MFICSDSDSLVCERSCRRSKLRVARRAFFYNPQQSRQRGCVPAALPLCSSRGCLAANVAQARRPKAYAKGLIKRPQLMPVRRFAPPGLPLDGGSLRILKVDLNQRKRQSDGGDNDDKGHEPPISGPGLFFVLLATRSLQVWHQTPSLIAVQ